MNDRLAKRTMKLTASFTVMAVLFGLLQAPSTLAPVGAVVGLILGLPLGACFAVLLRRKVPIVAVASISLAPLAMLIVIPLNQTFHHPFIQIPSLLMVVILLAVFLPMDKSLRDRSLCQHCAYPISSSPVCTECGAAVSNRTAAKGRTNGAAGEAAAKPMRNPWTVARRTHSPR